MSGLWWVALLGPAAALVAFAAGIAIIWLAEIARIKLRRRQLIRRARA